MDTAQPRWNLPDKALIGMVHVRALPGTPYNTWSVGDIAVVAVQEAVALTRAGFDALILENMHDRPYCLREVGPEIVAGMTAVGRAVRAAVTCPLGIQVLAGANRAALAVAQACEAAFIRAEGFVFAHVADEGIMGEADAANLLRYRRAIGAEHIAVVADIKKKHSAHAITADVDLAETAKAAAFFGADGVIVTGTATGHATRAEDVSEVADAVDLPVLVGSGTTPQNLADLWPHADGFIVGSSLKVDGVWSNPLDPQRVDAFVAAANRLTEPRP
ncbi:MAG TPA: BtpA/SgcQ family protein [Phycisphaerae bacterium]|nr:BtpA/SgcQ family protein [Phycisphaerales bacterium]HRX86082.1 BtpA/SgcQ family protein [Phycisphaerae bacterium]